MTAPAMLSASGSVLNVIGQFYKASLLPNIEGGQPTGDVIWGADRNVFTFKEMRSKNEYIKIIDDYFTRYGYKTNLVKLANITGRAYWNYVEIGSTDVIGVGTVPSSYMEEINNACRKGVTIWHSHDNLGDFSLNNSIL